MGFWIFMLMMDLLIPLTMIGFGRYFMAAAPKEINSAFEGRVKIVNSSLIVVNELIHQLEKQNLLGQNSNPEYTFYLSDYTDNFNRMTRLFFGKSISLTQKQL